MCILHSPLGRSYLNDVFVYNIWLKCIVLASIFINLKSCFCYIHVSIMIEQAKTVQFMS